jgi:hypothetical protein
MDLHGSTLGLQQVMQFLPWIVSVEADQFYLPEAYAQAVHRPWTRRDGEELIGPRLQAETRYYTPPPAVAADTPALTAPCPCGSG